MLLTWVVLLSEIGTEWTKFAVTNRPAFKLSIAHRTTRLIRPLRRREFTRPVTGSTMIGNGMNTVVTKKQHRKWKKCPLTPWVMVQVMKAPASRASIMVVIATTVEPSVVPGQPIPVEVLVKPRYRYEAGRVKALVLVGAPSVAMTAKQSGTRTARSSMVMVVASY